MTTTTTKADAAASPLAFGILVALALSHGLNDLMQSVLIAIYPILKQSLSLNYTQVGLIGGVFHVTASVLQPIIGHTTDRRPMPYSVALSSVCTLAGLILLGFAPTYGVVLIAASMIGVGSSIFHPESSRIARIASGGRFGLAQSLFQLGGNAGTAIGPLLAALIIVPNGQSAAAWFAGFALIGLCLLSWAGHWYRNWLAERTAAGKTKVVGAAPHGLPSTTVLVSLAILVVLMFSKFFYLAGFSTFFTFYLIDQFGVSVQHAQILLFVFLAASAAGTILGGPIGDRIGARRVIFFSILGALPFTLALPFANLLWTVVLSIPIGVIMASAFLAIVVYAQSLLPGRVGLISGLFFGLAFGFGGVGAALLGVVADWQGVPFVYQLCAALPALGLLAFFLPRRGGRAG